LSPAAPERPTEAKTPPMAEATFDGSRPDAWRYMVEVQDPGYR
jgi:hypothetical protein